MGEKMTYTITLEHVFTGKKRKVEACSHGYRTDVRLLEIERKDLTFISFPMEYYIISLDEKYNKVMKKGRSK